MSLSSKNRFALGLLAGLVVAALVFGFSGCAQGLPSGGQAPVGQPAAGLPAGEANAPAAGSQPTSAAPAPSAPTKTSGGTAATQPSVGSGKVPSAQGQDVTGPIGPEPGF